MNLQEFCSKYKYRLRDRIDWEWDRYGDGIPSVTTILNLIVNPLFESIKYNYPDKIEEACERWTQMHSDAEDFSLKWSLEVHNWFVEWHTLYDVSNEIVEKQFKKDCSWKIDFNCYTPLYWTINVDIKTNIHNKDPKYKIQLGWYKYLNWYDWFLLYLDYKSDKYKFDRVENIDEYMAIFIELKDLFFKLLNNDNMYI